MDLGKVIKSLKTSLGNLSIYFAAALIPMLFSLISNPFLAKNLSPEDYAIIGYYGAFGTLFAPLVNFYFIHYYTKRFFELDQQGRLILRATLFKALIFFSIALAFIGLVLIYVYTYLFNSSSELPLWPYGFLTMVQLPITGIYTLSLADFRMQRKSKSFFRISVANGSIGVVLALILVVILKWGAFGRLLATLCGSLVIFIYILIRNIEIWKVRFEFSIFKNAIGFCIPLVIASMLTFFSSGYDKIILEQSGDIVALGIYSVGASIAAYLTVFSSAINDTFQPDIFESIIKRNITRTFHFVTIKIGIMTLCVILFSILAPYIIDILTFGRYEASTPFAIIIAISSITSMLYYSMSQVTVALGMTHITLTNKIIGSLASIISFKYLIGEYGTYGAAWGVVLSYLYFFIGNLILIAIKYKTGKDIH